LEHLDRERGQNARPRGAGALYSGREGDLADLARAAGAGRPGWQAGREYGEMMPSAGLEERLTHVVTQS
jgi:hypothetical protein